MVMGMPTQLLVEILSEMRALNDKLDVLIEFERSRIDG